MIAFDVIFITSDHKILKLSWSRSGDMSVGAKRSYLVVCRDTSKKGAVSSSERKNLRLRETSCGNKRRHEDETCQNIYPKCLLYLLGVCVREFSHTGLGFPGAMLDLNNNRNLKTILPASLSCSFRNQGSSSFLVLSPSFARLSCVSFLAPRPPSRRWLKFLASFWGHWPGSVNELFRIFSRHKNSKGMNSRRLDYFDTKVKKGNEF